MDTAYFTSPDGRSASVSSVTPKPAKPVSKVAQNAVAVPDDLQTPRQLALDGRAQVSPPSKRKDTVVAAAAPPKSGASGSVVPAQNPAPPVVPRKRPPEDSEESASPIVGEGREMPQQQRPKPKRPKAAPSLFIPKKVSKLSSRDYYPIDIKCVITAIAIAHLHTVILAYISSVHIGRISGITYPAAHPTPFVIIACRQ